MPGNCPIKGNFNAKAEKIYHAPWSKHYAATRIDTSKGERWFCTEAEAKVAGLGGLDVLVNNAGVGGPGKAIEEASEAEWNETININLRAVYFCTKFAVPALRRSKGNVVNIASVDGLIGSGRNDSIYCTTKGGVVSMTRDLAIELAPDIRVNCICPGPIDTDMLQGFGEFLGGGHVEAGYDRLREAVPMKRIARAEELANVVLYLASDMASFVTGSTNVADGGVTAKMLLPNRPR